MIGKPTYQLNLVDSVLTNRKKRSRSDALLQKINDFVDWSVLVKEIKPLYKSSAKGRPSIPVKYMIMILFLQYLYNLSDPQLEDALIDRLSFQRFVGFSFSDEVPDFTTIWRFRERLVKADILEKLFALIFEMIERKGGHLKKGRITIIDATIIPAARKAPKKGDPPSPQKDHDARATKKGNKGYFGYKGHVGMDRETGLVHHAEFTGAHVHDSQEFDQFLTGEEEAAFADKAYASAERKRAFLERGIYYGILDKGYRNRPLSVREKRENKRKSRIRNQVERVFAHLKKWYGYVQARYVTHGRNKLQFLFLCMLYNVRRALVLLAT